MNSKFQAAVTHRDDVTWVKLSGVIDEDNDLGSLSEKIGSGTAVIDVSEIERINSCGVRDWVNWLGRTEKNGASVVLVECSPAIVAQINLVNNFTGQGVVKSFYAPYFCPNCDIEKALLVETADVQGVRPFQAPSCRCDECDGPMDFDDMEDSYFAFLANTKKIVTDGRYNGLTAGGQSSSDSPKIRSRGGGGSNPGGSGSKPGGQIGSLPSIPSLPTRSGQQTPTGTNPNLAAADSSRGLAPVAQNEARPAAAALQMQGQGKMSMSWILVVVLLVAALGIFGYVIFGK
jgi:anti-anti-sigma regulatory factor